MSKARRSANARRATAELEKSRCTATSPRPRRCALPATWKSPESSARRSQSESGAICASSLRRSSESDTLELQETPLVAEPERPVRAQACRAHHAMARHEETEAVARTERAGRARSTGRACERRELAVGDDLSARYAAERLRATPEERRLVLEVDLDVVQCVGRSAEIGPQALQELELTILDRRPGPGGRKLMPDHASALEPELPHPPALDLVCHVRHGHWPSIAP